MDEAQQEQSASQETRDRLIEAATEVFMEHGYDGIRIQDITRRAGYTTGALYAHFDGRRGILAAAIMRQAGRLIGDMAARADRTQPGPGREVVSLLAEIATEPKRDTDPILLESIAIASRDPDSFEELINAFQSVHGKIADLINFASEIGVVSPKRDLEAMSAFFLVFVLGSLAVRGLGLNQVSTEQMEALMLSLRDLFMEDPLDS